MCLPGRPYPDRAKTIEEAAKRIVLGARHLRSFPTWVFTMVIPLVSDIRKEDMGPCTDFAWNRGKAVVLLHWLEQCASDLLLAKTLIGTFNDVPSMTREQAVSFLASRLDLRHRKEHNHDKKWDLSQDELLWLFTQLESKANNDS